MAFSAPRASWPPRILEPSGSEGAGFAILAVAMENMIARSALLNSSSMGAVCWDFDGEVDG
jgi:hypothetical protein